MLMPYVRRLRRISTGAAEEVLSEDPVIPGRRRLYKHISARDATSAFTSLVVRLGGLGYNHDLYRHTAGAAGELYSRDIELTLGEGQYLSFAFAGTTAGDVLEAFVLGFEEV